jgi:hypothetical protein
MGRALIDSRPPHPMVKLTAPQVAEIKARLKRKEPLTMADEYGVSRAAILQIHRGNTWGWVRPLSQRAISGIPPVKRTDTLLPQEVAQIKYRLARGEHPRSVAFDYGISDGYARAIGCGTIYAGIRAARGWDGTLRRPERQGRRVQRPRGRPRPSAQGEISSQAKLTNEEALELLTRLLEGEPAMIADEYGVSESNANSMLRGDSWKLLYDMLSPRLKRAWTREQRRRSAHRRTRLPCLEEE